MRAPVCPAMAACGTGAVSRPVIAAADGYWPMTALLTGSGYRLIAASPRLRWFVALAAMLIGLSASMASSAFADPVSSHGAALFTRLLAGRVAVVTAPLVPAPSGSPLAALPPAALAALAFGPTGTAWACVIDAGRLETTRPAATERTARPVPGPMPELVSATPAAGGDTAAPRGAGTASPISPASSPSPDGNQTTPPPPRLLGQAVLHWQVSDDPFAGALLKLRDPKGAAAVSTALTWHPHSGWLYGWRWHGGAVFRHAGEGWLQRRVPALFAGACPTLFPRAGALAFAVNGEQQGTNLAALETAARVITADALDSGTLLLTGRDGRMAALDVHELAGSAHPAQPGLTPAAGRMSADGLATGVKDGPGGAPPVEARR